MCQNIFLSLEVKFISLALFGEIPFVAILYDLFQGTMAINLSPHTDSVIFRTLLYLLKLYVCPLEYFKYVSIVCYWRNIGNLS